MDRGTIDQKLSVHDAYNKYLVWKQKPGTVFDYSASKKWYWIKKEGSTQLEYIVAELKSLENKKAVLVPKGGIDNIVMSEAEIDGYEMNDQRFDGVDDCAQMTHLSDASVLHNLKVRYDNDCIYTYSGLFCVALNPYIRFPIYTLEMIKFYENQIKPDRAPHVFAMAQEAYTNLIRNGTSQSMLVTGESGAGKTENTKKIIQYLAVIAGNVSAGGERGLLEEQLIQANPLLEALGNAKTTKNDNSSRFGKFIKITFGHTGRISGASVKSYLLEKSRVTHQGPAERNFHIFYQLVNEYPGKDKLGLTATKDYAYITDESASHVESQPNNELFKETMQSLDVLKFSQDDREVIFTVVAAVLHLGNIKFTTSGKDDQATVSNPEVMNQVSTLLGVDPAKLTKAIVYPERQAGKGVMNVAKTPVTASASRDALARQLYNRMFLWVVSRINQTFTVTDDHFIGILDIAGFEIFKENSFEQLCINFTNERLQQFFNNHMFTLEQEEYEREGIPWKKIVYDKDNKPCIDLITKVFSTLVDAGNVSGGDPDKAFTQKCITTYKPHPKFNYRPQGGDYEFEIKHYAGNVTYTTKEWIEKNKDPLEQDLQNVISGSKNKILGNLFTEFALTKTGAMATVSNAYNDSLKDLMSTLQSTFPHFIRCIIPNHQKLPHAIDSNLVLEQLTCNGVLEGVRIARLGYPNRLQYAEFVKRYFIIVDEATKNISDKRAATQKIMDKLTSLNKIPQKTTGGDLTFAFGKTKIFFKVGVLAEVERYRGVILSEYASKLQAIARGYAGRKYYQKIKEKTIASTILCDAVRDWLQIRSWSWYKLYLKLLPLLPSPVTQAMNKLKEALSVLKKESAELVIQLKALEEEEASLNVDKLRLEADKTDLQNTVNAMSAQNEAKRKENVACVDELKLKAYKIQQQMAALKNVETAKKQMSINLENLKIDKTNSTATQDSLQLAILELQAQQKSLQAEIEEKRNENARAAASNLDQNNVINEKKQNKVELGTRKAQIEREKAQLISNIEINRNNRKQVSDEIKSLEGKKGNLTKDLNALYPQLEETKRKRIEAEALCAKLAEEFTSFTTSLQSENNKTVNLNKFQATLGEEHARLTEDLKVAVKARQDLTRKFEKEKKALNEGIEELAHTNEENASLAIAIKKLEEEIVNFTKRLEEAEILISKLTKTVEELRAACKVKSDNIDELAMKNASLEGSNKRLAVELEEFSGVAGENNEENEKLKKKQSVFDSQITALQVSIVQEKEFVKQLQVSNEELNAKISTSKVSLDDTEKELSLASHATLKIMPQIKEMEAQSQTLTQAKKAIDERKQVVQQKRADILSKKEELEDAKMKLEEVIQKGESEKARVDEKINESKVHTKGLTDKIKDLGFAVEELKKEIEKLEIENDSEERKVKNLQFDLSAKGPSVETQRRRIVEQEKIISDLELDIKRQNVLLEELMIKKQTQEKIVAARVEKIEQMNEKLKNFEQNVKATEKEVNTVQLAVQDKTAEVENEQRQVSLLKNQIAELMEDLEEANLDIEKHGRQQEIEKRINELIVQKNEMIDRQVVASNNKKRISDERKILEDRTEPLIEDIKKLEAQNETKDRENSNLQGKIQYVTKQLAQLEVDNSLQAHHVAKHEKVSRKEKSKKLSVAEVLNNAEKENALYNEIKNQIKTLDNEWRNDQRATAQFNRQFAALEIERDTLKRHLTQIKINIDNTIYLQEKLKREQHRLNEEKLNIAELREALEIINIDKEAEGVRLKDEIRARKEKQATDQEAIAKLRKEIAALKPAIEKEKSITASITRNLSDTKSAVALGKLEAANTTTTFEQTQDKTAQLSVVRETKRALKITKKLETRLKVAEVERDNATRVADKVIKTKEKLQVDYENAYNKRVIAQKEVDTLKTLIFDTQQFAREMQTAEDKLQLQYERMVKEIATLTNKIGIYSDSNVELEKPDSDVEERKEMEKQLQVVVMEANRLKQELTVMRHQNKNIRRQNTDASIATNEMVAMAKKMQKLLAEQTAKTVVARSTYSSLKVALHTYESKHQDCTRELNDIFKKTIKDTDNVRYESEIESLSELLDREQQGLHKKIEEIEYLEAHAEELRFDCRALKYELAQQGADNRRTKREVFDLQNSVDLKLRMKEVMDEELEGYDYDEDEELIDAY